MTVKDVSTFLSASPRTAQRVCMMGDIPAARLSLRYYVMRSALIERILRPAQPPPMLAVSTSVTPRRQICKCRRPCQP